ncbi:unnamed protein product [Dibothriocephalus latus]|uniref:Uncharacterized protein n=1 Tax=Dibothriocephalus latus TaxID=60516 RepID=A0A3P7MMH0_DIBLA|nr:unnamed protein product [Dibothriocephalus latus]
MIKGKWWNYAGDIDSEVGIICLYLCYFVSTVCLHGGGGGGVITRAKDSAVLAHPVTKPPQRQGGDSKKNKQQKKQNTPVVANGNAKQVPQSTENTVLNDLEDTELVIFNKVSHIHHSF